MRSRGIIAVAVAALLFGWSPAHGQHHFGHHLGHHLGHIGHHYVGHHLGHHLFGWRHRYLGHHNYYVYYPRHISVGWGYYPSYFYGCGVPYYSSGIYFQSTYVSPIWLGRSSTATPARRIVNPRPLVAKAAAPAARAADPVAMVDFLKAHQKGQEAVQVAAKRQQGDLLAALERQIARRNEKDKQRAGAAKTPMERGDDAFRQGKYEAALAEYDRGLRTSPTVATWLRKSFALAALQRFDEAADALAKAATHGGTQLKSSDCPLDELFADPAAKTRQLDRLAQAALQEPDDGNRLLLVGAFLLFDGRADRAGKFFDRAALLALPEQIAVAKTLQHVR